MRLIGAHVRKYRSIRDSGFFEVPRDKAILVGPNEAGKTALLQALQKINPPPGTPPFEALRDYPRSELNDLETGAVKPADVTVVEGHFDLDQEDKDALPADYRGCTFVRGRRLDNSTWEELRNAPPIPTPGTLRNDLLRLAAHATAQSAKAAGGTPPTPTPEDRLQTILQDADPGTPINGSIRDQLLGWLDGITALVDEASQADAKRLEDSREAVLTSKRYESALATLSGRLPVLVLFGNYFRVRPLIHLEHLAQRLEQGLLDDRYYDYGNQCLLKFLGFKARELSDLGKAPEPAIGNADALKAYRDQIDRRQYSLNAASVRLTREIRAVWQPDPARAEADRVKVVADRQYLKAVVEDDLGVEVELDQRSEGFQWLVSFFIVFFAEAADRHKNAILLLDEPGLSLHALKQRDFRITISKLAQKNQTLYTTHSPFLVGPDELDLVRVVEMKDRNVGTVVHTTITAQDPAALLPLQEALGYDLASSLFTQKRNMVLEGLTDYWYVDAMAELLRADGAVDLNEKIALVPAGSAGKVVYFATILHTQGLKVAALLDSDAAGEGAARQETLVHLLGNKRILRTKDVYSGSVASPEIEDLLRERLIEVAKSELGWDVETAASSQPKRPIVDIFASEITSFSKYKLAKAFLRWTRQKTASDLSTTERDAFTRLLTRINDALK